MKKTALITITVAILGLSFGFLNYAINDINSLSDVNVAEFSL